MIRRRWIIFHTLVILLIAYVSSYVYISRLRFEQWKPMRLPGFVYVSPESMRDDPEETWRIKHGLMCVFFAPLNKLDQELLGSPSGNVSISTGIGQKKR